MGANGRSASPLWKTVQALGIVATIALVAGLLLAPTVTLAILWNLVVPLLPASFLLTPAIWRNACPVATLNMLPNRFGLRRHLAPEFVPKAGAVAIVLLAVLVPARRFLLNTDGTAMAFWSLGSLVVAGLLVTVLRLRADVGLALLGAAAVTAYYWFAGPTIAETLTLPAWGGHLLRGLAFALIVVWLWRAMSQLSDTPARPDAVF